MCKYSAPSPTMHRQKAKCLLHLKHDCHTIVCRASLWSYTAIGTKEYMWPTNWYLDTFFGTFWKILCWERISFWNIDWKMFFLSILSLSIQCKIRCDRPSDTQRSIGRCDGPIGHPWSIISAFKATFFWLEFWTFYLNFYTVHLY